MDGRYYLQQRYAEKKLYYRNDRIESRTASSLSGSIRRGTELV